MNTKFNNLFVLSYGAVGDFCILLYFLDHVHKGNPNARLYVLTTRGENLLREMAANYPFVKVVPISLFSIGLLFLKTLLRKNIFVVPPNFIDDVPSFVVWLSRGLTFLTGKTIGFTGEVRQPRYDITLPFDTSDLFYKNFTRVLEVLKLPSEGPFTVEFKQDDSALSGLGEGYIALAPFASNSSKTLPPKRWVDLLKFLGQAEPGRAVAILGAPSDAPTAIRYIEESGHTNAHMLCKISFAQMTAVVAHSSCFIGVDSGLTHVAGVMRVKAVAIENLRTISWLPKYSPNTVILVEPKNCICDGKKGRDCYWVIDGVQYSRCMVDISQERIERAIIDTLHRHV